MAVTFGKTATIRTGGGARLIVTPESQISVNVVTGFTSGDFAFADIISRTASTPPQTSPKTGTLFINISVITGGGNSSFGIYKNGAAVGVCDLTSPEPEYNHTIAITAGDTLSFTGDTPFYVPAFQGDYVTITIKNNNNAGVIVDSFTIDAQ